MKILIIEGYSSLRRIFKTILEEADYEVILAVPKPKQSFAEAVQEAILDNLGEIKIVLLDTELENGLKIENGFDLVKLIKQIDKKIKIVLMSNNPNALEGSREFKKYKTICNMCACKLLTPTDPEDLVGAIQEASQK